MAGVSKPRFLQEDGRPHGVVFGVRRAEDGRWLMVRRAAGCTLPGKVAFPGGGMEAGEIQEQAVVREAREELGIDVRPVRPVWRTQLGRFTLFGWYAEWVGGEVTPDPWEVAEVLWLSLAEVEGREDGLPTNPEFIRALEGLGEGF